MNCLLERELKMVSRYKNFYMVGLVQIELINTFFLIVICIFSLTCSGYVN